MPHNIGYYSAVPTTRQTELKNWLLAYEKQETPCGITPPQNVVEMGFVIALCLHGNERFDRETKRGIDSVDLANRIALAANEDNLF